MRVWPLLLLLATPASAWDSFKRFEAPTPGPTSGGGGNWGTGGARDGQITCAHCHVKPVGKVYAQVEFFPQLSQVGPNSLYRPGQKYQVKVALVDESLGRYFPLGCAPGVKSLNGFAAAFENSKGVRVGRLESDSGQDAMSCPAEIPDVQTGSTVTFGACNVITASLNQDTIQWFFEWTAPPKNTGPVVMFYGVVDGSCDQKSTGDGVKMGTVRMSEGQ